MARDRTKRVCCDIHRADSVRSLLLLGGKGQKAVARLAQEASTAGKNKESMAKEKQRDQEAKAKLQEQKHNKEVADRMLLLRSR